MTENERNELIRFIESITFYAPKDGKTSWIKSAFDMIKEVIISKIDDIYNDKEMREIDIHRKSYKELQQTVIDLSIENCLLKNKVEEMKWIPVSERLPNRHQRVLCYFKYKPDSPDIISGNTYIGGGMWMSEGDKVVAWMPLPEPYIPNKGEQND